MGLSEIDILLIHDCDVWTHGAEAGRRFKEAMEGAYRALDKLRSEKTVGAIGFGINEADTCVKFARAGDFDVAMMAGRYSLLIQNGLAEFLPLALEKKMGVMLAGVFNSGILATGAIPGAKFEYAPAPPEIRERVRRIEAICATHGTSIRRAALHFAMAHPAVVSVVLGAARPEEAVANATDAGQAVPPGLWSDLKSAGLLDPSVPIG
jgi:D-threo-aldose 1-dehydrogenase